MDMSIMMSTTINQKFSPFLNLARHRSEKAVRPRLHCSDPFVHLRLHLHLSRLRQEREKPEEHTHKQGLDITRAEDIRSHATTIPGTAPTKYENHSCTSDEKKKKKGNKGGKKKSPSREQRKISDEEETSTKGKHSTIEQTTQSRRSGGKKIIKKAREGLDGQTRTYLLYMSLEQGEPRRVSPIF